jgi:hypothetical protein
MINVFALSFYAGSLEETILGGAGIIRDHLDTLTSFITTTTLQIQSMTLGLCMMAVCGCSWIAFIALLMSASHAHFVTIPPLWM